MQKNFMKIGVKIIIGPVFNKNLIYLDELQECYFFIINE